MYQDNGTTRTPANTACSRLLRARDRRYFGVILCSALAAAERQPVRRLSLLVCWSCTIIPLNHSCSRRSALPWAIRSLSAGLTGS